MTLPEQSNRAVAQTREFLVRLCSPYGEGAIKKIRREVRAEALALLRHYPRSYRRSDEKRSVSDMDGATVHPDCTLTTAKLGCETSVWMIHCPCAMCEAKRRIIKSEEPKQELPMANTVDIDIVESLRYVAKSAKPMDAGQMREAANEIERLRQKCDCSAPDNRASEDKLGSKPLN